jgi:Cys-rich protein (TIGR01571 family)
MPDTRAWEGLPVTPARGQWAVDLCACWSSPYCVLPFCSLCSPCVPLARAAGRSGVLPYWRVLLVALVLSVILMVWPAPGEETLVETDSGELYLLRVVDTSTAAFWIGQVLFYALFLAFLVLVLVVRRKLIRKYELQEHPARTLAYVLLCWPCAVAQQSMHVDLVEVGAVQTDCSCGEHHPLAERQTNGDIEML